MKNRRLWIVIALVITLALFTIPWQPGAKSGVTIYHAQGSLVYDFDFTSSDGGFTAVGFNGSYPNCSHLNGQYVAGVGWESCSQPGFHGEFYLQLQVPASFLASTITSFTVTFTPATGGGIQRSEFQLATGNAGFTSGVAAAPIGGSAVMRTNDQIFIVDGFFGGTPDIVTHLDMTISGGPTYTPSPSPTFTASPTSTPTNTPTPTPLASGPCSTSWTKTYDFTQQAYGFVNTPSSNNTWMLGTGFTSEDLKSDLTGVYLGTGDHLHAAIISRQIYSTSINSGRVTVDYHPGGAGPSIDARDIFVQLNSTTLVDGGNPPPAGSSPLTFSGSWTNGTLTISAIDAGLLVEGESSSLLGSATIKSLTLSGSGYDPDGSCSTSGGTGTPSATVWDYPLAHRDTLGGTNFLELGLLQSSNPIPPPLLQPFTAMPATFDTTGAFDSSKVGLLAFSQLADANVHSMTDGTVGSVTPIDVGGPCYYTSLPIFTPPAKSCGLPLSDTSTINLDYTSASLVEVDTVSAKVFYIVNSPEVQQGQVITAGCILGKTIKFYVFSLGGAFSFGGISVVAGSNLSSNGYTIVYSTTSAHVPLDVLPFLQVDPPDKHCGQGNVGGCDLVNNAIFAAPNSEWTALNADQPPTNPAGQTQGLLLIGRVYQSLTLDPSQSYIITVNAHLITPLSGGGRQRPSLQGSGDDFTVQLGSTTPSMIVVTSVNSQQTVIAATTYTPTVSGTQLFNLTIGPTDSTQSNIIVDYVCVSTSGSGPVEPSSCMFVNPDFNDSTGWTAGGGTTFSGGLAIMPNTGTLTQSITLNPKDGTHSQDYVLAATARRQGAPSGSAHIDLAYTWHGGSSTPLGNYSDQVFKTVSSTFTVSSATTGNIVLTASGSSQVLELDSICITTSDGITPPGYKIPPPISITATCKVCAYSPIGDVNYDLPEVIGWLECSLAQIWECEAKQILLGIWQALINLLMFLGMMRLWLDYTFFSGTLWVNANLRVLANWLNGQFVNLANQLGDTIRYGPLTSFQITQGGGSNFFDALISISNTISNLFTQLGTLITSLRDVLLSLFDKLWSLLTLFITLAAALITLIVVTIISWINMGINFFGTLLQAILIALNAPPVIPEGMPFCDTSASMIPASCLPIFYLDNTALADGGMLTGVIPILEGLVAFGAIWWSIGRFRNVLSGGDEQDTS